MGAGTFMQPLIDFTGGAKMAYGYIDKLNENVERKHVRFNNRFGIDILREMGYLLNGTAR